MSGLSLKAENALLRFPIAVRLACDVLASRAEGIGVSFYPMRVDETVDQIVPGSHRDRVMQRSLVPTRGEHRRHWPDYRGVPSVAFTVPPIATLGPDEESAAAQGLKFRVKSGKVPEWITARRLAEPVYGYKTLVEEGSGCILGAHIVGPHAEETINLFGMAIRHGLTADDI